MKPITGYAISHDGKTLWSHCGGHEHSLVYFYEDKRVAQRKASEAPKAWVVPVKIVPIVKRTR